MLEALGGYASERKLRLFACACCRLMWELLPDAQCRAAVEVAERLADDLISAEELAETERRLGEMVQTEQRRVEARDAATGHLFVYKDARYLAILGARAAILNSIRDLRLSEALGCQAAAHASQTGATEQVIQAAFESAANDEDRAQADLLRDLFSEWFRPVELDLAWLTSDVLALARGMYESRDFGAMPILADALQDAGCDNADVLAHCRGANAVHVRGCWVVDLLLGKV